MAVERAELEHYAAFEGNPSLWTEVRRMTTAQSMARYRFASRTVVGQGGTIIDAASGSGWGANHLSQQNSGRVIGIDHDARVVKQAGDSFQRGNLSFQQADLRDPATFDGLGGISNIVSFETIEHVSQEDASLVLRNFHSVHDGEGKLIISTPNRKLFSPYYDTEGESWDPFHVYEYDAPEFTSLLESNGWAVDEVYGQAFCQTDRYSAITRTVHPFRKLFLKMGGPRNSLLFSGVIAIPTLLFAVDRDWDVHSLESKREPIFLVAVCSKK